MFRALCVHHQGSKLYYKAPSIVTPVGGRPVQKLREDLCTGRPPAGVMIPDAV